MRNILLLNLFFGVFVVECFSQQTIGLFTNSTEAFEGYTLFGPQDSKETFLIDNCGEMVHSWTSEYNPGLSAYLMTNGILLRTGRIQGMGGGNGLVEMLDWESNVIWTHSVSATHGRQHHDIELLPNGNILLIVWDERSQTEVDQTGSTITFPSLNAEQIVEIQPDLINGGATVVWEWKAWDHLVQDQDSTKDNFGVVAQSPERIDINFLPHNNSDWLHFNGIDYNAEFDQIIISVHNFSEFWIIDHSTTTSQAAGSTNGTYEQGGDLLYRWGNPQAYDQGTTADQKLFLQHHTHWVPEMLNDAGKILLFNNQAGTPFNQNYSTVNIVELPVDQNGFYTYNGNAFGPTEFDWTYQSNTTTDFFSNIISGVQRLENGNTLVCEGVGGRFFEIDENENTVWEYINPVNSLGPITQNTVPTENNVFRSTRYAVDYEGLNDQMLIPQGYIEIGSTFICDTTAPSDCEVASIFANETTNAVCFEELENVRKCYTNNIPDHVYGPFGGGNTLEGQDFEYSMCLFPEIGMNITELIEDPNMVGCGNGIIFGTTMQGVNYSPFARLYWVNPITLEENLNWHVEADFILNMDINGGHVNAANRYHYHNISLDYFINDLDIDGSNHSPILGYAADGFPIYYKYLYSNSINPSEGVSSFESSFSLKSGDRLGDGIIEPNGVYDGNYIEDYEYIEIQSDLDECGMRYGITPEYPYGTYYYVLTDNWPWIPRCLKGLHVDNSFRLGQNCPVSTSLDDCSTIPSVTFFGKTILEGAYNATTGLMNTDLVNNNLLPNQQPFNSIYGGIEYVENFETSIVDWLLIELRNPGAINEVISTRAGFLRNDGVILDIDFSEGIKFAGITEDSYKIVIKHRNHLSIMSSLSVDLPNGQVYDFSVSANQADGIEQLKPMDDGKYAMYSGETDFNNVINVIDFNTWLENSATVNQYGAWDFDLNGISNNLDYNKWFVNRSKVGNINL